MIDHIHIGTVPVGIGITATVHDLDTISFHDNKYKYIYIIANVGVIVNDTEDMFTIF